VRILHCVPSMAGGGAERQLTYLAREHVRAGWDVHVALIHEGPNFARLEETGAVIHRIHAFGNHDPFILWRLLQLLRSVQPDVVQCWLLQMEVFGGMAASLSGTPWVFSERAAPEAYPSGFKNWLRDTVASRAAAIVSNSFIGDEYWRTRAADGIKRVVIPNGLPLAEIAAAPIVAVDAVERPAFDLLLAAGRFEPEKNLETLIRAIHLLPHTRQLLAILCGDGSLRTAMEEMIARETLSHRVRLSPYASDLWGLMKRADLLVAPSLFEGSPNVVLEAMACGCPLIVSDIPAHREILDDQSAVFVNPASPAQLASAIEETLSDPGGRARRARAAHERVQQHSVAVVAQRYSEVYSEVSPLVRRAKAVAS
jgi:glycosyltransferase involved in cell wall biosynthesis